jgi:transposase-like protein
MCQNLPEREPTVKTQRNRYSADFKAKLALEVLKGNRTLTEIASDAQVHPNLLMQWKRQLLDSLPTAFADKRVKDNKEQQEKEAQLYQQIGQLKVELDWLKKKVGFER